MSLDKAIQYGKEKRKPYRKAKAISKQCRNHKSCAWCRDNRTHKFKKNMFSWRELSFDLYDGYE